MRYFIILFFIIVINTMILAENITFEYGNISIETPEKWSYELEDKYTIITPCKICITFRFDRIDTEVFDEAYIALQDSLEKRYYYVEYSEPDTLAINGLDVLHYEGPFVDSTGYKFSFHSDYLIKVEDYIVMVRGVGKDKFFRSLSDYIAGMINSIYRKE